MLENECSAMQSSPHRNSKEGMLPSPLHPQRHKTDAPGSSLFPKGYHFSRMEDTAGFLLGGLMVVSWEGLWLSPERALIWCHSRASGNPDFHRHATKLVCCLRSRERFRHSTEVLPSFQKPWRVPLCAFPSPISCPFWKREGRLRVLQNSSEESFETRASRDFAATNTSGPEGLVVDGPDRSGGAFAIRIR